MNNKSVGVFLLAVSGLVAAIGAVGEQITNAIVQGLFFAGRVGGDDPPGPGAASPYWLIMMAALVLAGTGLFFLFGRKTSKPYDRT
jgi:hypothetical protein